MKSTKSKIRCGGMSTILVLRSELLRRVALVLALGLMVCQAKVSEAAPMGTAFTYQGRLMDANSPADGVYDFWFILFDEPNGGGFPLSFIVNDLDVIDGYFTVELDFGSDAFDGDARWLEILVRPGDSNDFSDYVTLSPRQRVTPTPYALNVKVPLILSRQEAGSVIMATNSTGDDGIGVYGEATGRSGHGVYGKATGDDSSGVHGEATGEDGTGVLGYASGDASYGVVGSHIDSRTAGRLGGVHYGAYGRHYDSGNYGYIGSSEYAGYFNGNVNATGNVTVGGKVGIGTPSPAAKMEVADGSMNGKLSYHYDTGFPEGITHYSGVKGTYGAVVAGHLGYRYQVLNFDPVYYGVHGSATTSGNNVGVYGSASGGTSNWAGYFNGNVYAGGKVGIGTASPQADLDIKHKEGSYRVIQATASDGSELFNVGEHPLGNGYLVIMDGDGTSKVLITANGNSYFNGGNVAIDGDLTVSGAYKGDIGPNNGAPFPRPAYDSWWVGIAQSSTLTLTHNIGGDLDNYVVDMQFKLGSNIHNQAYGGDRNVWDGDKYYRGAYWHSLTNTEIKVYRRMHDDTLNQVRVRIWLYN